MRLRFEYRTRDGRLLDGVKGGKLTYTIANSVKSAGKITLTEPYKAELVNRAKWLDEQISISAFKDEVEIPLGVFTPSLPDTDFSTGTMVTDMDLLDKLSLLDTDEVPATYSYPAGANVISSVIALLDTEPYQVNGPATETLINPKFYDPGTSKLFIANDLLETAGYFSLWCDGRGVYRIDKYLKPMERPIAGVFEYGGLNEITGRKQNIFDIPNRFVAVGESTEEEPPLVGVAENHNPDSPYSIENMGRVVTKTEEAVKATSQTVLDNYALQRLESLTGASTTYTVNHLLAEPILNDRVRATHTPTGIDTDCVIQRIEIPLNVKQLVTSTIREVTSLDSD